MEHKQFHKLLCERTGRNSADIEALEEGLAIVIRQCCADLDTVAVPTFGSFTAIKHKEEIVDDLSTGKRMLLPPEINVEFTPSASLLNRINPAGEVI